MVSTVTSQQEASGFEANMASYCRFFLCEVFMFAQWLHGFLQVLMFPAIVLFVSIDCKVCDDVVHPEIYNRFLPHLPPSPPPPPPLLLACREGRAVSPR